MNKYYHTYYASENTPYGTVEAASGPDLLYTHTWVSMRQEITAYETGFSTTDFNSFFWGILAGYRITIL